MRLARDVRDAGVGVIELIVAIVVSGIVLAGVATVFARSWQTQEEVMSVSHATNRGQVVGAAIERAVRNALFIEVADAGTVLRVSTSLGGNLRCQAFQLSPGGSARFITSGSALGDSTTWPEWQNGITADGGAEIFNDSLPGRISYRFQIGTESAPVRFAGEISPRSSPAADNGGCWL
ncbi:hypothetical protein [Microbacterium sp. Marseille-Q6648]|uniref:PilW family protein n=1 Tax=Microbacterium sp. Marseille-Q6648 TaxID=2937991 RepID=UPI00203AB68E|nr:hypothetical protein [Microbacterium sp. Marseille-Q6648]